MTAFEQITRLTFDLYFDLQPALEEVPDNDWFCYECDPRTNNKSHLCFTCGGVGISKATIKCDTCPRYVHLGCMLPPALRFL